MKVYKARKNSKDKKHKARKHSKDKKLQVPNKKMIKKIKCLASLNFNKMITDLV
jgi:hypothetical protein